MLLTDTIIMVALALYVVAWCLPSLSGRAPLLILASVIAFAAAYSGFTDDRWQAVAGLGVSGLFLLSAIVALIRRNERDRFPFVSGFFITLLALFAGAMLYMFPVSPLPIPSGSYHVGVKDFELTDTSRPGLLGAPSDAPRRLLVRVWYPAENIVGLSPRPYFTDVEAKTTATGMGAIFGFPPFFSYTKHVTTNSYEDAPLLVGSRNLPTIIYSHGYTSFAGQNTVLMEELASHGYVIYSVQHSYDSSPTVFPNGDILPNDPSIIENIRESMNDPDAARSAEAKAFTSNTFDDRLDGLIQMREEAARDGDRLAEPSARTWTDDRIFILNQLQNSAVPTGVRDVVAASRFDRTGQMGMSFGGSTSGDFCLRDPRCAAGINLDGFDYHFTAVNRDMPVPFLMFHSDMETLYTTMDVETPVETRGTFNDLSYERFETAGSNDTIVRLMIKGASHLGVSDFNLFMHRPVRDPILGTTPADIMIRTQNDFVRGFFDKYLRGESNDFPAEQFSTYEGWAVPVDSSRVREWFISKSPEERSAIEERVTQAKALVGASAVAP